MLPYGQKNVTGIGMCGKENTTKNVILDKTVILVKITEKKSNEKHLFLKYFLHKIANSIHRLLFLEHNCIPKYTRIHFNRSKLKFSYKYLGLLNTE